MPVPKPATRVEIAAWCLAALALFLVLRLELLPALVAGLTVYELVAVLSPLLERRFRGPRSRVVALGTLIVLIILILSALVLGLTAFFRSSGGVPTLLRKLADVLEASAGSLPDWLVQWIPQDVDDLRETVSTWLREHSRGLREFTGSAARALLQVVIGMVVGAMLSLHHAHAAGERGPFGAALAERAERFGNAFRRVFFAQARISAINTVATAIYLFGVLPLFGVHLPLKPALVALTFVGGLIPVVGNLIANTAIVLVSLSVSLYAAAGSLVFLVVIHKMEYFLNARIIGSRIDARSWELLAAMLVFEAAFGIGGVVAAPFYYAYVKRELTDRGLI